MKEVNAVLGARSLPPAIAPFLCLSCSSVSGLLRRFICDVAVDRSYFHCGCSLVGLKRRELAISTSLVAAGLRNELQS